MQSPSAQASERRTVLTLDRLFVILALLLTALIPLVSAIPPHDFWWHMAVGRLIAREGRIPTVDTFSYTRAGNPFYNQSWLAQLGLYEVYSLGGVPLLLVLQALVMAFAYGLILWTAVRRCEHVPLVAALLLAAVEPISYANWMVRPQSYAVPIFAAFLTLLTGYRLGWWHRLWPLVPLMALWVNVHGSFVLGLVLIALTLLGEGARRFGGSPAALAWPQWRRLALWGAATAAATLINPRGFEVYQYVRALTSSPSVTRVVIEWASPTLRDLQGTFFFLFTIGFFLALVYARRRPDPTDMVLVLPFLWLSLMAGRNIIWFAMVALPPLADALASRLPTPDPHRPGVPALNGALLAVAGSLLVLALPWFRPALRLPPDVGPLLSLSTPVRAVRFLRTLPSRQRPRRLFHDLGFGSYLIWAAPEQPVFIDPRFELYPLKQINDYRHLGQGCNVSELLGRYQVDGLLLDPRNQRELLRRVRANPRWRVVYRDRAALLLLPSPSR